jgi:hypothetical protein
MKIAIALKYWAIGGAEVGYRRLSNALPYDFDFVTAITQPYDVVIYSNSHDFYKQAKSVGCKKIIQRTTGPRSYNLPQPNDLHAIVCSSVKAYNKSQHPNKVLIYNLPPSEPAKPIKCDLLYSPARIGVGQCVDKACDYAYQNQRLLTVLGGKQHLHEDTYYELQRRYPEVQWTGVVNPTKALRYMKGCEDYIVPTSVHGVSNAVIEAVAMNKNIINLGGVEVPDKENIDPSETLKKWIKLLEQ